MKEIEKTPKLRFRGYDDDWIASRVADATTYVDYRGKTPPKSESGIFLITAKNVKVGHIDYDCSKEYIPKELYDQIMRRGKPCLDDVLITTEAPLGNVAAIDRIDIALAQRIIKLRGKEGILSNHFLKHILLSPSFQKSLNEKSTGSTAKGIKGSVLHKLPLVFPSIAEQQKIAAFLSAVDEKIGLLARKKELLLKYKKGVMQQIFDHRIRFKDPNGDNFPDWEEKRLSQISTVVKRTLPAAEGIPVMTISGRRGFLNQEDRFSKVIAGESLENYIALKKGELAYNRGNSKSAMYGSINIMTNDIALVPFVYHCFKLKNGINPQFIEYFSTTEYVNRQLRRVITSTARMNGLLNISKSEFFETKFKIPCCQEQKKIVGVLRAFDQKIEAVGQQLEKTRTFKKGLLQQMFV